VAVSFSRTLLCGVSYWLRTQIYVWVYFSKHQPDKEGESYIIMYYTHAFCAIQYLHKLTDFYCLTLVYH